MIYGKIMGVRYDRIEKANRVPRYNLFLRTVKRINPSFVSWVTPPFRVFQFDNYRVPPILSASYRSVRNAAIQLRSAG